MKAIVTGLIRKLAAPAAMKAVLAASALGAIPAAAQAHHHHDRPFVFVGPGCVDVRVGLPVAVAPLPDTPSPVQL